jgi:hypothetical protein
MTRERKPLPVAVVCAAPAADPDSGAVTPCPVLVSPRYVPAAVKGADRFKCTRHRAVAKPWKRDER